MGAPHESSECLDSLPLPASVGAIDLEQDLDRQLGVGANYSHASVDMAESEVFRKTPLNR